MERPRSRRTTHLRKRRKDLSAYDGRGRHRDNRSLWNEARSKASAGLGCSRSRMMYWRDENHGEGNWTRVNMTKGSVVGASAVLN
jgi:hypothetical protein